VARKPKGIKPNIIQDDEKLTAKDGDVEIIIHRRDARLEFWAGGRKYLARLFVNKRENLLKL
jgi:hypothetical protein